MYILSVLYVAKLLTQEFPISEEVDLSDMTYDEGMLCVDHINF